MRERGKTMIRERKDDNKREERGKTMMRKRKDDN